MSDTLKLHHIPRLPDPLPRRSYVVIHDGSIEVGAKVRVIELGEPIYDETAERISFADVLNDRS